jgi:hypothetical protein
MANNFFANYPGGSSTSSSGGGGGGNSVVIDTFTLSSTDITNMGVILSKVPTDPDKVVVEVDQAPGQAYNVDYTVNSALAANKTLSWSGLGLQGELSAGDIIEVIYY